MILQPESKTRLSFGPFQVDFDAGQLSRGKATVRLSGQPLQILRILLMRPGEVVSREELREQIWKDGTFVDFEHGLNAAMNKLRKVLGDSADDPRYVETIPGRGYRFIGVLANSSAGSDALAADETPEAAESGRLPELHVRRLRLGWWLAAGVAVVAAFSLGWKLHGREERAMPWSFTRLTWDSGLSDSPAISRDGSLVAYSSDHNKEGQRDLYLIQVAGDQPIRLTFDGQGNTTPDFSPDGSRIAYHSDRDGGGIYLLPAFGGEPQLLARGGLNPRFSPDGSQVAYWIGDKNVSPTVPGNGTVWIVPTAGGRPRQLAANLANARYPIWSSDGQSLLLTGYASQKAYQADALDWWVVSADGSRATKTGAYEAFVKAGPAGEISDISPTFGTPLQLEAACWLDRDTVIFYESRAHLRSLWQTSVSKAGRVNGVFRRLTEGAGNEVEPSCATPDRIAFTNRDMRRNIWRMRLDSTRGAALGGLEKIIDTPTKQESASLSADGHLVAYASARTGKMNIWVRGMADGKETRVASMPLAQRYPVSNAAGTRIAFSVFEKNGARSVYVSNPAGSPEKVCDGCFRATDWSRDGDSLLVFEGNPYEVSTLNLASHQRMTLLKSAAHSLLYAHYSPDNKWVSFTERLDAHRARIMIAPVTGTKEIPESAWIQIAEVWPEDWANWSSDGRTLYFTSPRDGHFCFWGQRLDPISHRPAGDPFAVLHLHGRLAYEQAGWSIGGGQLAMVATEDTGDIWLMTRAKPVATAPQDSR